jgi:hypothetical protein
MTAVLRVDVAQLDVDPCLARMPNDKVEAVWRAGKKTLLGKVHTTSGFNLLLSDSEDNQQRGVLRARSHRQRRAPARHDCHVTPLSAVRPGS